MHWVRPVIGTGKGRVCKTIPAHAKFSGNWNICDSVPIILLSALAPRIWSRCKCPANTCDEGDCNKYQLRFFHNACPFDMINGHLLFYKGFRLPLSPPQAACITFRPANLNDDWNLAEQVPLYLHSSHSLSRFAEAGIHFVYHCFADCALPISITYGERQLTKALAISK